MTTKPKLLQAKLDNVKNLSKVIKAINFKSSGVWFISECGIKVVVEDSKCVQANAFIGSEIFEEYKILNQDETAAAEQETETVFRIDLSILVDCLTIFDDCSTTPGATTALKMTYEGTGHPLKIILEEEGVITDCLLKTLGDCDTLDLDIMGTDLPCKVILKASDFKEVLGDLDPSSDFVEFLVSPAAPPFFRIITEGLAGRFESNVPKNSDIVDSFQCSRVVNARYRYSQIKPCLNSLKIASKVAIMITDEGLICLQFMIPNDSKQHSFVEYYCIPCVEDIA